MTQDNNPSEFGSAKPLSDECFDFSNAKKIEAPGSICDAYEGRHHRRRVFVKRLKPEFRKSSLHRAALDKEFDIGVSLNHPSLPHYLEFHGDYIILDYIEGQTLNELIVERNPWLKNERNLFKMLRELLDVIDYLHIRRIFHADLKPDNILLSGIQRHPVLIDFDKSHSDWLDDTDGNPKRFGLSEDSKEFAEWDFKGLAQIASLIAEELNPRCQKKLNGFAAMANKKGVTSSELRDYISRAAVGKIYKRKSFYWILGVAAIIFIIAFIGNPDQWKEYENPDSKNPVNLIINPPKETPGKSGKSGSVPPVLKESPKSQAIEFTNTPETLHETDEGYEYLKKEISKQFAIMAKEHFLFLDECLKGTEVDNPDRQIFFERYDKGSVKITSFLSEAVKYFPERYGDLTNNKVLYALYNTPEWIDFTDKFYELNRRYAKFKKISTQKFYEEHNDSDVSPVCLAPI